MNLSELSLKRPVLAIVCSIVIIIFGVIGFSFLGVREFPAIEPPIVNVRTQYTGANAEIIEQQITEPLEKAVNGVEGVKTITSSSSQGSSSITVEFELGVNIEKAANDVREKVSQAINALPQDIDAPPSVAKQDDSDFILMMQVQSNKRTLLELSDIATNVIQERLQTVPGISSINLRGKTYAMRLWFDPAKLSAYKLTIQDVRNALDRENIELPGGKVRGSSTELTVKAYGKLSTEEDFNNLIITQDAGRMVRFKDIGYAILGTNDEESAARKNNVQVVSLQALPQPGSNQVAIANELYKRIENLKKELPEDITLEVGFDRTTFVRKAITEVKETLFIAILLVVIIIYLFFRDWSIAFRPLIDIPVSLVGAFFIMYVADFSINVLTMLSLVLATGLVVDDGIVVTENIFKKMEAGMDKWKAAREGANEIYFAVIATSITLAIVFLPIIFLEGFVGRLFREFGIVVAGAVLISAFVSLTLTPVLNIFLTPKSGIRHSWFYHKTEPFYRGLENGYRFLLSKFMKARWIALVIVAICVLIIVGVGGSLPSELAPIEDRNRLRSTVLAPEGTDFDLMDRATQEIAQQIMDSVPERQVVLSFAPSFFGAGGVNSSFISMGLIDGSQRQRSQDEIAQQMNRMFKNYTYMRVLTIQEQTISVGLGGRGSLPVQFVIQNLNFDKLKEFVPKFMDEVSKSPVFQGYDVNLKFNKPELQITIDRLKSSELGVSILDITNTLQLALSGRRFGYFIMNGKQYQVIGQVDRQNRDEPLDLKAFYVRNRKGELIQLDNLVTIVESANPPSIYHYNRLKNANISAGLAPGKTLGDGINEMERIADKVLDDTFTTSLSGVSRDFRESSSNTSFAFILALILIFLVLAAQFESFVDPFIIMITVPLALAGAVLALWTFGQSLNIFSQIGIIMLIGLVTKNGILIVEFANQKREHGLDKYNAAIESAVQRLRPILMTTLATTLGALPIAIAFGSAGKSRVPLGIVIVGGMLFALVLTLFVVPALYSYISRKKTVHYED
jgi:multidrug efflux pump